ncbi:hypothetical protein Tco_0910312 [Tanacetum coccineum]|uniref:Uncharacterized protein n=1 Tax=Tanacetum coccineum TaxID=301880 RepID=A0ABQ5CU97_9ASTR
MAPLGSSDDMAFDLTFYKTEDFYVRNFVEDGSGDEVICDHFIGDSVEVEMHAPRVADKGKAKMLDDGLVVKHRKANVKNKGHAH